MSKLIDFVNAHRSAVWLGLAVLFLLLSAALIFWPELVETILRYAFAVINAAIGIWLIAAVIRMHKNK